MYSDATRRTACKYLPFPAMALGTVALYSCYSSRSMLTCYTVRLEKPEEAVDIMEMEYKQWGKSNAMAHKHLRWGYDASIRGSVKNFILRKETEVMPREMLVKAICVKNQGLSTVQGVQSPRISDTGNEQNIQG